MTIPSVSQDSDSRSLASSFSLGRCLEMSELVKFSPHCFQAINCNSNKSQLKQSAPCLKIRNFQDRHLSARNVFPLDNSQANISRKSCIGCDLSYCCGIKIMAPSQNILLATGLPPPDFISMRPVHFVTIKRFIWTFPQFMPELCRKEKQIHNTRFNKKTKQNCFRRRNPGCRAAHRANALFSR